MLAAKIKVAEDREKYYNGIQARKDRLEMALAERYKKNDSRKLQRELFKDVNEFAEQKRRELKNNIKDRRKSMPDNKFDSKMINKMATRQFQREKFFKTLT